MFDDYTYKTNSVCYSVSISKNEEEYMNKIGRLSFIIGLVLIIMLVSGCTKSEAPSIATSTKGSSANTISSVTTISSSESNDDSMTKFSNIINMSRSELISYLGKPKDIGVNADSEFEFYDYVDLLGFTVIFPPKDDIDFVSAISIGSNKINIKGTTLGLTFEEIESIMGTTEINTYEDEGENTYYKITYSINDFKIDYYSHDTTKQIVDEIYIETLTPRATVTPPEVQTQELKIGDSYGGGIVAYILQNGDPGFDPNVLHGFIAAETDQCFATVWCNKSFESIKVAGTHQTIGSGLTNTDKIIAQNGAGKSYAAGLARAYSGGGYSDWYLPSIDELHKLCDNQKLIGGFIGYGYWSSSEVDEKTVWARNFETNLTGYATKNSNYSSGSVRAIRNF